MYVIVAVVAVVVLVAGLLFLLDRALKALREGRRRRNLGMRLYHAAAQAAATERQRQAAAQASNSLTAVLPAIRPGEEGTPRKVA
jgi:predicted ABC-type transport system involved in lysophospholipase L1 biosynthesis ATPase subunit